LTTGKLHRNATLLCMAPKYLARTSWWDTPSSHPKADATLPVAVVVAVVAAVEDVVEAEVEDVAVVVEAEAEPAEECHHLC